MITTSASKLLMATGAATGVEGTIWSTGYNVSGQLGDGTVVARSSPVQAGSGTNYTSVVSGITFALALRADGTIWGWGLNNNGQLGLSDAVDRSDPTQIGSDTDWAYIATNLTSLGVAAIKTGGELFTWGLNSNGQLGLSDVATRSSPVQVGSLTDWSFVVTYEPNGMRAIKTDGTLWAWGINNQGFLGINLSVDASSPVQVGALTDWAALNIGVYTTPAAYAIRNV